MKRFGRAFRPGDRAIEVASDDNRVNLVHQGAMVESDGLPDGNRRECGE